MKRWYIINIILAFGLFTVLGFGQDTINVHYGDTVRMQKAMGDVSFFTLRRGLPDGYYKVIYKNSPNTWYGGKIEKGRENGKWTKFSLGKLESEYYYENGVLQDMSEYYETGQLKRKIVDSLNVGYSFNEDGTLSNLAIGFIVRVGFYWNQSIQSIEYFNDEKKQSIIVEYNEKGQKVKREIVDLLTNTYYTTVYDGNGNVTEERVFPRN